MTTATITDAPLLHELLRTLRRRARLLPLLREAAAEEACVEAARDAGLSVTDAELQRAADEFRQRSGLGRAADVRAWLAARQLTALDLQESVERDLLIAKFKEYLTRQHAAGHFDAHRPCYERARLRLLVAASEGEARELLAQVYEDGRDFAELARRHSLHAASRNSGGDLGVVLRCQLPSAAADAVFAAAPGHVVGPLPGEGGFCLFCVEELLPAELDGPTAAIVAAHLLDDWLRQRLAGWQVDLAALRGDDGAA